MSDERMRELQDWSFNNFRKIPIEDRKRLYALLAADVPDEVFDQLLNNHLEDKYVFEGFEMAHFGLGMGIRNLLRQGMTDDRLPPVVYEGGQEYRNWDDYYLGAIVDWLEFYLDEEADEEYEMAYVIARPWKTDKSIHEPGNMCIYTYGSAILRGTIADARGMLQYVRRMSEPFEADQYGIYEVSFMEIK